MDLYFFELKLLYWSNARSIQVLVSECLLTRLQVVFDAVLYLKPDWSVDSEIKPDFPNDCGEFSGHARKVTMRFSQNLEVFSDGAVMMKHLNFRVRCVVSADASATSTMQLDVQL